MSRLKLPPNPRHLAPSGPGSLAGAVTTAGAVRVAHCVVIGTAQPFFEWEDKQLNKMTTLDLLTFRILLMSLKREHTWVLMFPKEAIVIRLPLLALGEKSCWSYVGLLNY